MKKESIEIRISKDIKEKFKEKTADRGLTMSELIIDMIYASLANNSFSPNTNIIIRNMEICNRFNNIYNLLAQEKFDHKNELIRELGELECLL